MLEIEPTSAVVVFTQQSNITFTCNGVSDPLPDIEWYREDTLIQTTDSKYSIANSSDITVDSVTSILTVLNIQPSDTAQYTCNATNNLGQSTVSASLTVHSK